MTLSYDAILFDFDGVLADTEPVHWSCWRQLLTPVGIDLPWDIYVANLVGIQDRDMLPFLATLSKNPIAPGTLETLFPRKKELFRQRVLQANPITAETVELVHSLTNHQLAVVTSSGRSEVEAIVERAGIRDRFATMVFGEDVKRHKPAPDPYLLAASRLNAKRPLVVEDSNAGVASATAAGFDVIRTPSSAEVPALVRSQLGRSSSL